jgi:hypothetical protein
MRSESRKKNPTSPWKVRAAAEDKFALLDTMLANRITADCRSVGAKVPFGSKSAKSDSNDQCAKRAESTHTGLDSGRTGVRAKLPFHCAMRDGP